MSTSVDRLSPRDLGCLALIGVIWVAAVAGVDPRGNFPLNDDWSYAICVRELVAHGEFRPIGWTSMPLLSQALWGALFCLPFGFSFTALRLSTLVLGLAGVFALYALCRRLGATPAVALLVALTLAFNPIYFALSFTFMTDVPFAACALIALLVLRQALATGSRGALWAGTALASVATLCRQLGLAVSLGFALACGLKTRFAPRQLPALFLPLAVSISALSGLAAWLAANAATPSLYTVKAGKLLDGFAAPAGLLKACVHNGLIATLYLGLSLAPVLVLDFQRLLRAGHRRVLGNLAALVCALTVLIVYMHRCGQTMPLGRNVLRDFGIGPPALKGGYAASRDYAPPPPEVFWQVVTVLSIGGAALLLVAGAALFFQILRRPKPETPAPPQVADARFMSLTAAAYFAPLAIVGFFDRYLIFLAPILAAALVAGFDAWRNVRWRATLPGFVLVAFFATFSFAITRDYLAWNRARWSTLDYLTHEIGATPSRIDGGFEFNGLYGYRPDFEPLPGKSWWWVEDDLYVVAFGPLTGYRTLRVTNYPRLFPRGPGRIYALQREP